MGKKGGPSLQCRECSAFFHEVRRRRAEFFVPASGAFSESKGVLRCEKADKNSPFVVGIQREKERERDVYTITPITLF